MSSRMRTALAAASVATVLGLAGCAAEPEPDLTAVQAQAFRSQVVAIADTSSRGEYANALVALDALQAEVDRAAADGELDGEREQRIRDAMALVRADLEAAIAAIPSEPEPAPAPAPAPEPEPAPPPADDGGDDDSGPGNSDQGKDKGKGKDKP
ncbi:hypothetical protein [Agromyces sp. ZXT2-6]|uniref:hypothetical protein n=1 Tax=Agromyces sp. ZXT2-6 TaxID=3461153 RepID=UPI004054FCC6